MVILAGDIGDTNARLGLSEPGAGPVQSACFAVAGPVSEGRVAATNLAWIVDNGLINEAIAHILNDDVGLLGTARPAAR